MTVITDLPDADALLALPAEDLAPIVLHTVVEGAKRSLPIHVNSVTYDLFGMHRPDLQSRFPQRRQKEIELLVAEAWHVLESERLLVPEPGINGTNGFRWLTSRGEQALKEGIQFRGATAGGTVGKSILHPAIADPVSKALARGDLENAVLDAFKAVEIAVRDAGGYSDTDIGIGLVRKAFDPQTGALTDESLPLAEREALAHLFAGAMGYFKNPHSHRTAKIVNHARAQEMVSFATHLLYIVDERRAASP